MKIGWTNVGVAFLLFGATLTLLFVILHWADVWTGKGLLALGALLAGVGAVLSGWAAVRTSRKKNGNGLSK